MLLLSLNCSCQEKSATPMEAEEKIPKAWEEMGNSPLEYPAEVYQGGLERRDVNGEVLNYRGLNHGLITGPWGSTGGGMSRSWFVPTHINCIWLSYAEHTFYKIDVAIDHDKMLRLFQEGYPDSLAFQNYGEKRKSYFNSIITGFAPGGVVVIWLAGGGRQVEIGRYKGVKYEVDAEEIAGLEQEVHVIFEQEFREAILSDSTVIPLEVQKANKNKPIPYGLWDSYRTRYSWRPVFEVQKEGSVESAYFEMINGEKEQLFDQTLINNIFVKRALPQLINLGWRDKQGQKYGGYVKFDESEIFKGFSEIAGNNPEAPITIEIKVNMTNTFVTATLISEDKKVPLKESEVKAYKSRRE